MQHPDLPVGEVLRRAARDHPDRLALVAHSPFGASKTNLRWTFSELDQWADVYARGAMAAGLEKGDRAAVWVTNIAEWVLLEFALARAGVVLVTVNTAFKEAEVEYLLRQSESIALFFGPGFRDVSYAQVLASLPPLPELRQKYLFGPATPNGALPFRHLEQLAGRVSAAELRRREQSLELDDLINMQYTSGTTDFPKGVMLTHRNIVNNGHWVGVALGLTLDDRVCVPVPLFHCFGCVIGVLGGYTHAAGLALVEKFDPVRVLQTIHRERCTAVLGVPSMFLAEMDHPDFSQFDLTCLRTGVMAGSVCPASVVRRVMDQMHIPELTIAYGLTEASPVITQTQPQDPLEKRLVTVGRALPHVEAKIVNPATMEELPSGRQGELVARGYLVMKGYYNNPKATEEAITHDGWLHSGDLATRDAEGYFTITGRLKEMIIRGGENIYPKEIEELLRTHPKVSDVAVFGVPNDRLGEEVAAAVRLKVGAADAEEIRDFVRARIAAFKVPRYIHFVEGFPQTASGKVQKFRLREMFSSAGQTRG